MPSVTGPQILTSSIDQQTGWLLQMQGMTWRKQLNELRKHPTIKIARLLSIAPAVITTWTTDGSAPDEVHKHIAEYILPRRVDMVRDAMFGMIDWGWAPFERVINDNQTFSRLKPLLQENTTIVVDPANGDYVGLYQPMQDQIPEVYLEEPDGVLFSQNVDGTEWYGHGDLTDAQPSYASWKDAEDTAKRYDRKTAGAHWVVHYPMGTSDYNGDPGVDNSVIANDLLDSLKSNGLIAIPSSVQRFIDGANTEHPVWKIELMESSANISTGLDTRLRYCDVLMVRAFGMTERMLQEGQFGTKAEAETHAEVAMTYIQMRLQHILEVVNRNIVKPEIIAHFGEEFAKHCTVVPEPMDADKKAYLASVYDKILNTPEGFMHELDSIDVDALRDQTGVPTRKDA
jgi:hypothetical protein